MFKNNYVELCTKWNREAVEVNDIIVQKMWNTLLHCYGHTKRITKTYGIAQTADSLDTKWEVMQLETKNKADTRNLKT
jgi:hypothetical protein